MVQGMDLLIHQRRGKQRNADQQVPGQAEAGQRILVDVGQLMDEQQGAVERQHADCAAGQCQPGVAGKDRPGKRGIAQRRRSQHVGPENGAAGLGNVAGQIDRGAQHFLVVCDRRELARGDAG